MSIRKIQISVRVRGDRVEELIVAVADFKLCAFQSALLVIHVELVHADLRLVLRVVDRAVVVLRIELGGNGQLVLFSTQDDIFIGDVEFSEIVLAVGMDIYFLMYL